MATGRVRSFLQLHKFTTLYHFSSISPFSSSRITSQFEKIGFVGLGSMGSRMANNLIKKGYNVTVHDINKTVMKSFSDKGIVTKESPFEVAESSDVVITMLPSSASVSYGCNCSSSFGGSNIVNGVNLKRYWFMVLDVYTGPNGFLCNGNISRPWLYIDSSTIDPQTSRKISSTITSCAFKRKKDGLEVPSMLDAPVSGGALGAEAATLTFMVGGSEEVFVAAKPLFQSLGKNTIYCGGAGNGSAAKICNNLAMAVSMLGISEAFALGQKLGISASTLTQIFNSSSARCWSSDTYNPVPGVMVGVPASRNYDGGFASKLMAKDLSLATTSAKEVGQICPLTSQAEKIFVELCNEGNEAKDFSCVFQQYYHGVKEP